MSCQVCGHEDTLTRTMVKSKACACCSVHFFSGREPSRAEVAKVRESLGLLDGSSFQYPDRVEAGKAALAMLEAVRIPLDTPPDAG